MLACLLLKGAVSKGNFVAGMSRSILNILADLWEIRKILVTSLLRRSRINCLVADLLAGSCCLRILTLLFRLRCAPSAAFLASLSTLSLSGIPLWLGIQCIRILASLWERLTACRVLWIWLMRYEPGPGLVDV